MASEGVSQVDCLIASIPSHETVQRAPGFNRHQATLTVVQVLTSSARHGSPSDSLLDSALRVRSQSRASSELIELNAQKREGEKNQKIDQLQLK